MLVVSLKLTLGGITMSSASESQPIPGIISGTSSHQPQLTSFKDTLHGANAFYNHPDYLTITAEEFLQGKPLPATYTWNTESKIIRIAKQIFSIIIFPIGIYNLLHILIGKIGVLPASTPTLLGFSKEYALNMRLSVSLESTWKFKRITIEVDGYKVDATIFGKESTLSNGRWVLVSNGNATFYEDKLESSNDFKQLLSVSNSNALVFNYPGVGASSGWPSRQGMAKAYRAMLNFLEDQKNGIAAKEIIGYGHSIGGCAQSEALKTHVLKQDVKYVFVKSRTFSNLSAVAPAFRFLIKILGWNVNIAESSKKLQAPEIILQTAKLESDQQCEEIHDSSKIIDDGVITTHASLAKALLDDKDYPKANKVFLGIKERHNDELGDLSFLAKKIEELLKKP